VSGDGPLANSAQRRVVGTSRQIEMNENITLVISDPFSNIQRLLLQQHSFPLD
jgi:hypothetical protein